MSGKFVKGAWMKFEPCDGIMVAGPIDEEGYFIKDKACIGDVTEIDLSQLKREKK